MSIGKVSFNYNINDAPMDQTKQTTLQMFFPNSKFHQDCPVSPVLWRIKCLYKERVSCQEQLTHFMNSDLVRGLEIGASCPRQPQLQETLRISHGGSEGFVPCLVAPTSASYSPGQSYYLILQTVSYKTLQLLLGSR